MKKHVLILSNPYDIHSFAVQMMIEQKGEKASLFYATDFPANLFLTVEQSNLITGVRHRNGIDGSREDHYTTVWERRPSTPVIPKVIEEDDRKKAMKECETMREAYFQLFAPDAFWVNKKEAALRAENKIIQQKIALSCGVKIPETLFSNDPEEIKAFIKRHEKVIYKTLRAQQLSTHVITEEMLPEDEILCLTPGIFQPLVDKSYELRITVIGKHLFAAKVNSQQSELGKVDWRLDHGRHDVTFERYELPDYVQQQCFDLLKKLDLVYGVVDLIVTPGGEYIFLEINQTGQFLFLEEMMKDPWPLADAMAEMLIQGTPDFEWEENDKCIRWDAQLWRNATERLNAATEIHQKPVMA